MSSSAPGSSGAIVIRRSPSRSGSRSRRSTSAGRPEERRIVGAAAGLGEERPLEVEPQRLRAVGGCAGQPRRGRVSANVGEGRQRRGHGRRQEPGHPAPQQVAGHPVEGLRAAHRVVAAPAVDVDVDEPGRDVWQLLGRRRTRGPSRSAVDRLDRLDRFDLGDPAVLDGDPAGLDPVVEDEATADGRDLTAHALQPVVASIGRLDLEGDRERVAVGGVARFGRLDRPAVPVADDASLDEQRVAGPDRRAGGHPRPWRRPRRSCPVPRRSTMPARPSVSWRDPWARSAVITASAHERQEHGRFDRHRLLVGAVAGDAGGRSAGAAGSPGWPPRPWSTGG